MSEPWYTCGLCFQCTLCGACCTAPDHSEQRIWVQDDDIEAVADLLGLTVIEFERAYIFEVPGEGRSLTWNITHCIFLQQPDNDGHRMCAIYAARPLQCRTWPFWAANVQSAEHWLLAGQDCPGIGRGSLHPAAEVELKRSQSGDWSRE